jgi:hypothetical protein
MIRLHTMRPTALQCRAGMRTVIGGFKVGSLGPLGMGFYLPKFLNVKDANMQL